MPERLEDRLRQAAEASLRSARLAAPHDRPWWTGRAAGFLDALLLADGALLLRGQVPKTADEADDALAEESETERLERELGEEPDHIENALKMFEEWIAEYRRRAGRH